MEGMIRHVTVTDMISSIPDHRQVDIEIALGLGRRLDGIDVVIHLHHAVVIVLCMVNTVMIAMAEAAIFVEALLEVVDEEIRIASEAQPGSVGAQVHVVRIRHCLFLALNSSSMITRLGKA